jgi:hypothetical protein
MLYVAHKCSEAMSQCIRNIQVPFMFASTDQFPCAKISCTVISCGQPLQSLIHVRPVIMLHMQLGHFLGLDPFRKATGNTRNVTGDNSLATSNPEVYVAPKALYSDMVQISKGQQSTKADSNSPVARSLHLSAPATDRNLPLVTPSQGPTFRNEEFSGMPLDAAQDLLEQTSVRSSFY